jgi:hypothetical protein
MATLGEITRYERPRPPSDATYIIQGQSITCRYRNGEWSALVRTPNHGDWVYESADVDQLVKEIKRDLSSRHAPSFRPKRHQ